MSHRFKAGHDHERWAWDDIIQPLTGRRLDVSSGRIDYNYALKGVDFQDNTRITEENEVVHFGYQIEHRFRLDGEAHPHIHWLQTSASIPNWWMRWRFHQNGKAIGDWTELIFDTHVFTYTSGTILQISYPSSGYIDFTTAVGGALGVSDFIDVEFGRDNDNDSELFSGSDPVSGTATIKAFDMHLQVDANGSPQEYSKVT